MRIDIEATLAALRQGGEVTEHTNADGVVVYERPCSQGCCKDTLGIDPDGTVWVVLDWGSATYWDKWVYPPTPDGPYYAGTVLDEYRTPPAWVVERAE